MQYLLSFVIILAQYKLLNDCFASINIFSFSKQHPLPKNKYFY